jgi:hypothetical protein
MAQCGGAWLPGQVIDGLNGTVNASAAWDPDGDGPEPRTIVVGGSFSISGHGDVKNLAWWDASADDWKPVATGSGATVYALAAGVNGELFVGGANPQFLRTWDGSSWTNVASTNGVVRGLIRTPTDEIVAVGEFTTIGGVSAKYIAKWDGALWSQVGGGLSYHAYAAHIDNSGGLVVVGDFTKAGTVNVSSVARWNGSAWSGFGPFSHAIVNCVTSTPSGDIYIGGRDLVATTGSRFICRWNGTSWVDVGIGLSDEVNALAALPNGHVIAAGAFGYSGSVQLSRIAEWDGVAWRAWGQGLSGIAKCITVEGDDAYIGGSFDHVGDMSASAIALRKDGARRSLGGGGGDYATLTEIRAITDGSVLGTGVFWNEATGEFRGIARWSGNRWIPVVPMQGTFERVQSGEIFIGGLLTLSRWNGTSLHDIVVYTDRLAPVRCMEIMPDGSLLVGGNFFAIDGVSARNIARWDGHAWHAFGAGLGGDSVSDIAVTSSGHTYVLRGTDVYKQNGASWTGITSFFDGTVSCIEVVADGTLIVGGAFAKNGSTVLNGLARWNGSSWSAVGGGLHSGASVADIECLPDGRIVVVGNFDSAGGTLAKNAAIWNHSQWSSLGGGISDFPRAVEFSGELFLIGTFGTVDGEPNDEFARYSFDGIPVISEHPLQASIVDGGTLSLSVSVADGYEPGLSWQWMRDGSTIVDGSEGASAGGGTVTGSNSANLVISGARTSDSGLYTCMASNACGERESDGAVVIISCLADFDASGFVDTDDFDAFVGAFEQGLETADADGTGFVDTDDFDTFVRAFEAGC